MQVLPGNPKFFFNFGAIFLYVNFFSEPVAIVARTVTKAQDQSATYNFSERILFKHTEYVIKPALTVAPVD